MVQWYQQEKQVKSAIYFDNIDRNCICQANTKMNRIESVPLNDRLKKELITAIWYYAKNAGEFIQLMTNHKLL